MSTYQKIYIFAENYFINSLNELKEYFKSEFIKIDIKEKKNFDFGPNPLFIIQESFLNNSNDDFFEKFKNNILLIRNYKDKKKKINFNYLLQVPAKVDNYKKDIDEIKSRLKFQINSFVKTGKYILDKNEKRLKFEKKSISLTEKEVQLIEILAYSKAPVSKEQIQKRVWVYSEQADTHTVETHIYRLRKKINEIFSDQNFIKNKKNGYEI
ncbi:MAG: hypothetical protein CL687_04045 [Candidatus Pelagibacter sp.]|nr:hypothetical protein [Candidatus Pelagibacter sp.]OUW23601.1 MAG: hypothetical protein CBD34_02605 [Rickettsiales bacterium TMED174]|tara:strand:- start:672 stop:1304 length:633 start_codon:yes stop_codon:yes gene_type:complete